MHNAILCCCFYTSIAFVMKGKRNGFGAAVKAAQYKITE
jgi:hypothetical protein